MLEVHERCRLHVRRERSRRELGRDNLEEVRCPLAVLIGLGVQLVRTGLMVRRRLLLLLTRLGLLLPLLKQFHDLLVRLLEVEP